MATNKQIYDALKVIEEKIPSNEKYIADINKNIKNISYVQRVTSTELKKMIAMCEFRRFDCGDN